MHSLGSSEQDPHATVEAKARKLSVILREAVWEGEQRTAGLGRGACAEGLHGIILSRLLNTKVRSIFLFLGRNVGG